MGFWNHNKDNTEETNDIYLSLKVSNFYSEQSWLHVALWIISLYLQPGNYLMHSSCAPTLPSIYTAHSCHVFLRPGCSQESSSQI